MLVVLFSLLSSPPSSALSPHFPLEKTVPLWWVGHPILPPTRKLGKLPWYLGPWEGSPSSSSLAYYIHKIGKGMYCQLKREKHFPQDGVSEDTPQSVLCQFLFFFYCCGCFSCFPVLPFSFCFAWNLLVFEKVMFYEPKPNRKWKKKKKKTELGTQTQLFCFHSICVH